MDNRRDWIGNLLTRPLQPGGNLWRHKMLFLVGHCPFYPFYQKVIARKFWLLLCKSRCLGFLSHKMTSSVVNQAKRYMWGGQPFSSWPFIKVSFQGQYIKAEVWDFPVITERMRLISYLLYGCFSAILKKNTIKTPELIFHIRLRALRLSSSLILQKYLYASSSFSYWKHSCILFIFSVVFAHAHVLLLTSKEPSSREKIS